MKLALHDGWISLSVVVIVVAAGAAGDGPVEGGAVVTSLFNVAQK